MIIESSQGVAGKGVRKSNLLLRLTALLRLSGALAGWCVSAGWPFVAGSPQKQPTTDGRRRVDAQGRILLEAPRTRSFRGSDAGSGGTEAMGAR
jgi:hypothetical protein